MGDRCFLMMRISREDVRAAAAILGLSEADFKPDAEGNPEVAELEEGEANHGYYCEREEMAAAGLIFKGSHSAGGGYPEAAFCAIDGAFHDVAMLDGDLAVTLDAEGRLRTDELDQARAYLAARDKVLAHFQLAKDTAPDKKER